MPKSKAAKVVRLSPRAAAPLAAADPQIARVVGLDPAKGVQVEYPDGRRVVAETTLSLDLVGWLTAVANERRVLVLTAATGEAVITGFVQRPGHPSKEPHEVVVRADGDRVVIQGREQIELRCGTTSLVLRQDGVVELRGEKIVSRSRGLNAIVGASVRIN